VMSLEEPAQLEAREGSALSATPGRSPEYQRLAVAAGCAQPLDAFCTDAGLSAASIDPVIGSPAPGQVERHGRKRQTTIGVNPEWTTPLCRSREAFSPPCNPLVTTQCDSNWDSPRRVGTSDGYRAAQMGVVAARVTL
jgi:hypothetical protein